MSGLRHNRDGNPASVRASRATIRKRRAVDTERPQSEATPPWVWRTVMVVDLAPFVLEHGWDVGFAIVEEHVDRDAQKVSDHLWVVEGRPVCAHVSAVRRLPLHIGKIRDRDLWPASPHVDGLEGRRFYAVFALVPSKHALEECRALVAQPTLHPATRDTCKRSEETEYAVSDRYVVDGERSALRKVARSILKTLRADLTRSNPDAAPADVVDGARRWAIRIALLRYLESRGVWPKTLTGMFGSDGYAAHRDSMAGEILGAIRALAGEADGTRGFRDIVEGRCGLLAIRFWWVFDDRAARCSMRLSDETMLEVLSAVDAPDVAAFWGDDFTAGWIYEESIVPEREAIAAKVLAGGKVKHKEIAKNTQFFTERYMVEWILQNSLGLTWLCMCRKHGWNADAGWVLHELDARRAVWRAKRDAGEAALDAMMPIEPGLEDRWKYYVPQALSNSAIANAPQSVRTLRLLDPANGCGFFLFVAFDYLVALYREEAEHRGEAWSDREIAESIVANNLHACDIDEAVTAIAETTLLLKAYAFAPDATIPHTNIISTDFGIHGKSADDPHVAAMRAAVAADLGLSAEDVDGVMKALADARYMGMLMKMEDPIREARERALARGATEVALGVQ